MARKPSLGATLNRSHPLSNQMAGLWLFNESNGSRIRDHVGHADGTFSGANPPTWSGYDSSNYYISKDPYGESLGFAGSHGTGFVDCGAVAGNLQDLALTGGSWFIRFNQMNQVTSGGLCHRDDANAVNIGWSLTFFSGSIEMIIEHSSANMGWQTVGLPSANQWHNLIVTYDGTSNASNQKIWVDGKLNVQAVGNGSGTKGSDSAKNLILGATDFNTSGSFSGAISTIAIWKNRLLTEDDVRKIERDPWCYMQRPSLGTIVTTTGGGGSFNPSWAVNGRYIGAGIYVG